MKEFKIIIVILSLCIVAWAVSFTYYVLNTANKQETKETEIEEPAATEVYDTTYLEQWCGEPNGTVRMAGGWMFNYEPSSGIYTVEDENGNLWCVTYEENAMNEDDFLLLWIDNNGTPDYLTDDHVIKVWKEAH